MFNRLTKPRINTTARSHPCARTWCVTGTSFDDILALGLVYLVAVDPAIIERGEGH